MKFLFHISTLCILFYSCVDSQSEKKLSETKDSSKVFLTVLGTLQDGGMPHAGCKKPCCDSLFEKLSPGNMVVCLGITDQIENKTFLFEATPNIAKQMKALKKISKLEKETPNGIFLTHAHIGHYSGLMYLGREAMNTNGVTVYVMPRMKKFLKNNGPWNQLIALKNIELKELQVNNEERLTKNISVTPLCVPHRDEYSETVGYVIKGPTKKGLFVPDIDKWEKWNLKIDSVLKTVDIAFIDGTFYSGNEINNRNIKEIPHPFVIETLELMKNLDAIEKSKIRFIHFNHTNPLINPSSKETNEVLKNDFGIARLIERFNL